MNYKGDDALKSRVLKIMQSHQGFENRIDRSRLVLHACGNYTQSNDRKVRDVMSDIATNDLPIVSVDGGYFIPLTEREAEEYRNGLRSRRAVLRQRENVMDDYFRNRREPLRAEQPALLEVR